jgi:hypothetical protein
MSSGDEAAEGRKALTNGRIRTLKDQFNLSWPTMANLIGVDAASLRMWVEGTREPSHASAKKLGVWLLQADHAAKDVARRADGVSPDDLVSLSVAAQYLGMSYGTVLQKCQDRELTCVDLGALGVYIMKTDLPILRETA